MSPNPRQPVPMAGSNPASKAEDARNRLLMAGLTLFANQGFAKTSTRELAEAANVNVASISYYFGDKAGLYRAVFQEPLGEAHDDISRYNDPTLSLPNALRGFYAAFLEPLRQGDVSRLCMKLHFREMLEPTGLYDPVQAHGIKPMHDALVAVVARHLRLPGPDLELERLAVCISALGVHLHMARDVIDEIAPALNSSEHALDLWADQLVRYGQAMVQAEAQRRGITLHLE